MSRFYPPRHHKTHEPGGSDEIHLPALNAGLPTQVIPLPTLVVTSGSDSSGFGTWVVDNSYTQNGYLGCTASGSYFGFMIQVTKGGIFALRIRSGEGPDFGRFKIQMASLDAPPTGRSGDPTGKIEGSAGGTISLVTFASAIDSYAAVPGEEDPLNGQLVFVVGGEAGDALTTFASGSDPETGYDVMDGGPGWYFVKVSTDGQNGSSTGFKLRFTYMALVRLNDDGYI